MKNQDGLTRERLLDLNSEIVKLNSKRRLQGDKRAFKNDEEFREAGLQILKKYDASDSQKKSFLELVDKSPFKT